MKVVKESLQIFEYGNRGMLCFPSMEHINIKSTKPTPKEFIEPYASISQMLETTNSTFAQVDIPKVLTYISIFSATDKAEYVFPNIIRAYDLKKLKFKGKMIKLKKSLRLNIVSDYKNEKYEVSNKKIRLFAISDSLDNAIDIIGEKFETLYDIYVTDTSMELTKDALKLREKLKEYY